MNILSNTEERLSLHSLRTLFPAARDCYRPDQPRERQENLFLRDVMCTVVGSKREVLHGSDCSVS